MVKYFTPEGLKKLKKELDFLKNVKRRDIAERLKKAISFGDLSENAEYSQAKEEQVFLEGKIRDLENTIASAVAVERKPKNVVQIGSTILVESRGKKEKFEIVGPEEAEPLKNKISIDSPLGKAVLGKQKGETVKITTPDGEVRYKILKVE